MPGLQNTQASGMIIEDQLKGIIAKRDKGKLWKQSDNKLLPKSQHSVFGNFPKSHMPEKRLGVSGSAVAIAAETTPAKQSKLKTLFL